MNPVGHVIRLQVRMCSVSRVMNHGRPNKAPLWMFKSINSHSGALCKVLNGETKMCRFVKSVHQKIMFLNFSHYHDQSHQVD